MPKRMESPFSKSEHWSPAGISALSEGLRTSLCERKAIALEKKIEAMPRTVVIALLQDEEKGLGSFFAGNQVSFCLPCEKLFGSGIMAVPPDFLARLSTAAEQGLEIALRASKDFPDRGETTSNVTAYFEDESLTQVVVSLSMGKNPDDHVS